MATTKKSLLTSLECKMLEWANLDIDAAEVVYKDKAEQFEKLMEESEKAYVTLKENKSIDALTERQKAQSDKKPSFRKISSILVLIGMPRLLNLTRK